MLAVIRKGRTETMPDSKRQITAQEATIKTASIEVKVLTLNGGKQMTLAVFRQLPVLEEAILDPQTLELRPIPWGTVNYHPDCDNSSARHLHVVWQQGNKLYRSIEWSNASDSRGHSRFATPLDQALRAYTAAAALY
jgi:hypothetical protein